MYLCLQQKLHNFKRILMSMGDFRLQSHYVVLASSFMFRI